MPQPEIQTIITAEMMQEAMRVFINEAKVIRQEAEAGNTRQQHNVAVLYTLGLGVPLDHKTAFKWFYKAADDGIPESQFNVAIALQGGLGTQKDLVTSYKYYILAASQGLPNSSDARDHLAQYLNREQIEAGQRMARGFLTKLERKRYYEKRREIESKKMEAIRKGLEPNNIEPPNTDN
jgi:TPR repeat protein